MNEIIIQLSKKKIILAALGCFLFIAAGTLGVLDTERFVSIKYSWSLVFLSSLVAILFFGTCLFYVARKLFSNKPGLVINDNGILDNSNANHIGLIAWEDIIGLKTIKIYSSKIILVKVANPKTYIDRSKNVVAKKIMNMNQEKYGSPIYIISNSLNIKFSDLIKILRKRLKRMFITINL